MERQDSCPSYDGVPEYGGPCWTCQNQDDHCPMTMKEALPLLALSHDRQRRRMGAMMRLERNRDQGGSNLKVCQVGRLLARATAKIVHRVQRHGDTQDD